MFEGRSIPAEPDRRGRPAMVVATPTRRCRRVSSAPEHVYPGVSTSARSRGRRDIFAAHDRPHQLARAGFLEGHRLLQIGARSARVQGSDGVPERGGHGRRRQGRPLDHAVGAAAQPDAHRDHGERPQIQAFHSAALGSGGTDNGPPGLRARLPPELLRGVRPRSRGQQHRGRLPRARGRDGGAQEVGCEEVGCEEVGEGFGQGPRRRSLRRSQPRRRPRPPSRQGARPRRNAARLRAHARQATFSGTCAGGTLSLRHEGDGSAQRAGEAGSVSALHLARRLVDRRCDGARRLLRRSRRSLRAAAPPRGSRGGRADAAALRRGRDASAARVRRLMSDELSGELLRTFAMARRLAAETAPASSVRRARAEAPAYLALGTSDVYRGLPYRDRVLRAGLGRRAIPADVPIIWVDDEPQHTETGRLLALPQPASKAGASDQALRDAIVLDQIASGFGHAILSLIAPPPASSHEQHLRRRRSARRGIRDVSPGRRGRVALRRRRPCRGRRARGAAASGLVRRRARQPGDRTIPDLPLVRHQRVVAQRHRAPARAAGDRRVSLSAGGVAGRTSPRARRDLSGRWCSSARRRVSARAACSVRSAIFRRSCSGPGTGPRSPDTSRATWSTWSRRTPTRSRPSAPK